MQRIFVQAPTENLSGEMMQNANQTAARQLASSVSGGAGTGIVAGHFGDPSAHKAALPTFAFLIVGMFFLFFLVYHSHVSLAASVGVGRK